jgi:SAM-dependent methyltransferase
LTNKPVPPKYFDVLEAEKAYREGRNITELLRSQKGLATNSAEIIEIAYDLQAGTYIQAVNDKPEFFLEYARELAGIIQNHVAADDVLLDVGTGELTTLSLVVQSLVVKPRHVLAFDISWSRIFKGVQFAREHMGRECFARLSAFVANIREAPLFDKSVNVTISSHALEPNGDILPALLSELFRVTRDKLILFEPCYEINSEEGKRRMDRLGYIKGIDTAARELGGHLIDRIPIKNVSNPLNPTACFIVEPPPQPETPQLAADGWSRYSVPGANYPLERIDDFMFSSVTRLCYPILRSIPILKSDAAILASALSGELDAR